MQTRLNAPVEARSVDRDNLTVDIIASTFDLDSYETRFDQTGWLLERFLSNPVITWAHDDRGMTPSAGLPIANAIPDTVRVIDGKLQMRLRFTPEEDNPFGYRVFRLIANGFLHGLSVGFDPKEWDDVDEMIDGEKRKVRVFRKIELQEVAVVTIPSNSNALVKRLIDLNQDPEEAKQLAEEVERLASERSIDPAEHEKYRTYFVQKQPVNKIASRVLEKFYKRVLETEPPADEKEAWETMEQAVEAMEKQPEEVKQEEVVEKESDIVEQPIPAEAPQHEEAPPERSIPLSVLKDLPKILIDASEQAVEKASRRGIPPKKFGAVIDELGDKVLSHLSKP